jgi:hypothetical protein
MEQRHRQKWKGQMRIQNATRLAVAAMLGLGLWSVAAAAGAAEPKWDLPTHLVDEPPGIAKLRAKYANMTEAELVAAGFQIDATYITATMLGLPPVAGAMGYHAVNGAIMGRQFPLGVMDPDLPPVVLLGADKRVIGVEWEVADRGQAPPQIHGQTVNLGPPHPGVDQPHYMLHAYFQPGGKVLFGDFNPALAAPGMPNTGEGGSQVTLAASPWLAAIVLAIAYTALIATVSRRTLRRR